MTVPPESSPVSVAEAFLALLKSRGVDYFYVGAGTDTAPLVEAYARAAQSGLSFPQPIVAAHENLAVGMAHGYYMVSGRPQAVMLHVGVGAGNAVCGLFNAARGQVPMIFTPGRTPIFEQGRLGARDSEIQWAQEMFDQAGMLRELVKWDYELRDGEHLQQVLDRALAISMAPPRGPVCLTLPREVLAQTVQGVPSTAVVAVPTEPAPDPACVRRLAQALHNAAYPVILCTASGADPATLPMLVELSDRYGIAVAEARSRFVCFPASHPLHLGYDTAPVFRRADALLFLESDVPWVPSKASPTEAAFVAHAGTDPLYVRYPVRSHRSDLTITSSVRHLLLALCAALEEGGATQSTASRKERLSQWSAELRNAAFVRAEADRRRGGPITKSYLSACLASTLPAGAIVVNEYPAVRERLPFDEPGRYFVHPNSAGLGWGYPAALGAQQAAPDKVVVALLGDGAYLFANPAVCHHASSLHDLPVLAVVFDNGGWEAVQNSTLAVYPQGQTAQQAQRGGTPLTSLQPLPDFGKYAEASGGASFRVSRREELKPALERAFSVVHGERRQALVHVVGKG